MIEPIIDLAHSDACALYGECLARVMVADTVLLEAADFIGEIESNGHIPLFDTAMVGLVLDLLCEEPLAMLGCNISPVTLGDRNAWEAVVKLIAERPWLARRLTLEITETGPLSEILGVAGRLAQIKRLDCRLALDNFGVGYAISPHPHGVDVAWDIVKVDPTAFGDLGQPGIDRRKLGAMVAAASQLAPVVVEGIGSVEHLGAARAAGARFGQGWMFEGPIRERWVAPDADTRIALEQVVTHAPPRARGSRHCRLPAIVGGSSPSKSRGRSSDGHQ